MAAYIRKVRTASGATGGQIAAKDGGRHKILEHLDSAHTEGELAALLQAARKSCRPASRNSTSAVAGNADR